MPARRGPVFYVLTVHTHSGISGEGTEQGQGGGGWDGQVWNGPLLGPTAVLPYLALWAEVSGVICTPGE